MSVLLVPGSVLPQTDLSVPIRHRFHLESLTLLRYHSTGNSKWRRRVGGVPVTQGGEDYVSPLTLGLTTSRHVRGVTGVDVDVSIDCFGVWRGAVGANCGF